MVSWELWRGDVASVSEFLRAQKSEVGGTKFGAGALTGM